MNETKITLSIYYENGTATLFDIASYCVKPHFSIHDDFVVSVLNVTLIEAVQILKRLGLLRIECAGHWL